MDFGDRERRLTAGERALGQRIFGNTIKWHQVRISNGAGVGDSIFTNAGIGQDTIHVTKRHYHKTRSIPDLLLVHELVHVWQATNHGLTGWGYKANSLVHQGYHESKSWVKCKLGFSCGPGRNGAYTYNRKLLGVVGWHHFSVEEQAQIVEDWYRRFRGNLGSQAARRDPAFRYVYWVLQKKHIMYFVYSLPPKKVP